MSTDSSSSKPKGENKALNIFKSFVLVLGTIGLFFAGQLVAIYILVALFSVFGFNTDEIQGFLTDKPSFQFLAVLLIESITIGALWWAHRLKKQPFLKLVGLGSKPKLSSIGYATITYIVYFLVLIVTVAIVNNLIPAIDVNQMQDLGFDNVSGGGLVFVFLTLVVLPPIAEEIIFRGFLYQRLRGLISIYPAAIITSIIFALAHTEFLGDNPLNWIAAIDTFILSFFLIFLLQKTKTLWASIFLHAIKNCLAFIFLFVL
jgi:membrane protease YdiL (CAAX protease family)